MTPDDERHGTYAGAAQHWKAGEALCDPCAVAASRRRKLNRVLRQQGRAKWVPSTGTVRRLRALRCLGWTIADIARATGVPAKTLRNPCHRGQYVHRDTFTAVTVLYEQWCMTRPVGGYHERARRYAARMGWAPPLAYDDIDTDPEPNYSHATDRVTGKFLPQSADDVDEVAVQRILDGDWRLSCTRADKVAVVARWTGSHNELERLTGWRVCRYVNREAAA